MLYCSKCGRKLDHNEVFCPGCGNRISKPNSAQSGVDSNSNKNVNPPKPQQVDPNSVQYVYVNKKTGKITNNPHVKTKSEGCLQYFVIAFAAVALVIIMVSGSVFLTNYLSERSDLVDEDDWPEVPSQTEVSSWETASEASSEPVSSEIVSSEPVSSAPAIPDELTAKYMNEKIKGKWSTEVPYKSMSLPGVFEFDGKGKAKCIIKAFLFSKTFEGTYRIKDGGNCTLTLNGIKEYIDDDTMVGDLRFVNDNKMEFTVEETVWKLNRME